MSDNTTIARPYAKAIFQLACEHKQLADWSTLLRQLATVVAHPEAESFILNPECTVALQAKFMLSLVESKGISIDQSMIDNVVNLLAQNKRLLVLPNIYSQFEALRAEQEKTLAVDVNSFTPMNAEQQKQLIEKLSARLQRQVTLNIHVDPTLLGGAIIRAGDLVIDGSVKGKLNKLAHALVA